jgi:hypothetical protein
MKISLIVLGALAASFLLRRRSAALRHWVLAAGVACAAAVPILTSVVPAWPLPFAAPTSFVPYHDPFTATALQARPAPPATAVPGAASGPPVSRRCSARPARASRTS